MTQIIASIVGKAYVQALEEVIEVRRQKRGQYGDSFLSDDIQFLKYQIENKLKRLNLQIANGQLKICDKNIETAKDSCIDICNYSLFLLAKILRGDKK